MASREYKRTYSASVRCSICGRVYPLQRRRSRRRGAGHVKHVWCVRCQAVTAHEEDAE